MVLALVAGVLVALNQGLAPAINPTKRALFLVVLALLLSAGAHRDFGQREHLAVALCLPWLLLVVGQNRLRGLALIAGVAAGIAICFKPHFLAVPVLVWLYLALRARSLRPVFRIEHFAILLTGAAYVAVTYVFARPYLTEVVPLISQVYWGFEHPVSAILKKNPWPAGMTLAALIVAWRGGWRPEVSLPALAALGFLAAALVQSKGYSYHYYPAFAFALISLILAALTAQAARIRLLAVLPLGAGMTIAGLQAGLGLTSTSEHGERGQHTACLVSLIQTNVPVGGGFMAFSTHPFPGFPVANYSDRRWVAATNSRLFMPSIARLRSEANLTEEAARVLALAEAAERAAALKEITKAPEVVLVDARERRHAIGYLPIDFTAFYTEDPAFAEIWQGYREIPSCVPGIRAFKRSEET
jgi:hypothetical protein